MEAITIAAVVLGPIEGEIGLHHDVGRGIRGRRCLRDTDAGGNGDVVVTDDVRRRDDGADLFGQRPGIGRA